ncbi:hypothetical protein [Agrobacterium rosae]|uniref:Uncharacterized protein n=1 Tax=Agrobacterium rosae TaxID=1972867 RepID=A0A1R3TIR2_9HYPH|nr:hypothetical protein [Agrobacterium rosae]SCX19580.1 hypothetical protein DSM25559_1864 [Agrobacterium rosae]
MPHYFFHMVYDEESKLDESGYIFSTSYKATEEAVLLLITLALEGQLYGKPSPRQVAVVEEGKPRTLVAIKDAT